MFFEFLDQDLYCKHICLPNSTHWVKNTLLDLDLVSSICTSHLAENANLFMIWLYKRLVCSTVCQFWHSISLLLHAPRHRWTWLHFPQSSVSFFPIFILCFTFCTNFYVCNVIIFMAESLIMNQTFFFTKERIY